MAFRSFPTANLHHAQSTALAQKLVSPADEARGSILQVARVAPAIALLLGVSVQGARAKEEYLAEPTAEFKDEQKKVTAFLAEQKKIRAAWDAVVARLVASQDAESSAKILDEMTLFLLKCDGMRLSVGRGQ
ncbi:hypothetical protein B484DRAFT_412444 [Ochromonadaceae sp. CCMP2298]|nr:hypothetical protein B484DRAFT_412444 [Ochromonadaceae sp. CCMP2298]